ncbi:hypothetical protein HOLleu_39316 [Holothuria leucospilota]|uniref:Death domain-containing protein n=1 Tax=Holothuria leucospilota TaxID=206669 RepID=A0A9Q1BE94_HOLLE|nr:hypothetical protein HOLleu_39316 [Holothuria leucospilota]
MANDIMNDDIFLQAMAGQIGDDWTIIGAILEIGDPFLQQMHMNNPRNQRQTNFRMLKAWTQREGDNATRCALASKLSGAGFNALANWVKNYSGPGDM